MAVEVSNPNALKPRGADARFGFTSGILKVQSDSSSGTAGASVTITPSSSEHAIVPMYFRMVAQCPALAIISLPMVYIERYAADATPGVDAALLSAWTPLTPYGTVTALGLITGARHWEWESSAPLEVAALTGGDIEGTKLHVRFASKASSEMQYIAVNYRDLRTEEA